MKLRACHNPNYVGSVPVLQSIQNFIAEGKIAPFYERRGSALIQAFITWQASGQYAYQAGRKFYFDQDGDIDGATIKAIELLGVARQSKNPTSPVVTDPIDVFFNDGYLVIVDDCKNEIAKIPLSALNRNVNGGKLYFCNFTARWENCYVVFPAAAGISQANSLCFNVSIDK